MISLGFINVSQKNLFIAILTGISQYFQIRLAIPAPVKKAEDENKIHSFKDEFAKSFQVQMKYVFPVMIFFLSYTVFPAAVAIYWTTSNLFSIGHEILVKRKIKSIQTTDNTNE